MFVLPFQNPAQEFFAAEIAPGHAFIFAQPFLDCRLRADSSVIHPRQPHHFPPPHPRMPRQNILDGSVKDVTESENASDVWGRYNDRERRLRRFRVGSTRTHFMPTRNRRSRRSRSLYRPQTSLAFSLSVTSLTLPSRIFWRGMRGCGGGK